MSGKLPIEMILDHLEWVPLAPPDKTEEMPFATHIGVLRVLDKELRVYQLSNGQRVINEEDLNAFFGGDE